jgi:hypothetical protein
VDREEWRPSYLFVSCAENTEKSWSVTCISGEVFPGFVSDHLAPLWVKFATSGTPAQAKLAVCCICKHTSESVIAHVLKVCNTVWIFQEVFYRNSVCLFIFILSIIPACVDARFHHPDVLGYVYKLQSTSICSILNVQYPSQ